MHCTHDSAPTWENSIWPRKVTTRATYAAVWMGLRINAVTSSSPLLLYTIAISRRWVFVVVTIRHLCPLFIVQRTSQVRPKPFQNVARPFHVEGIINRKRHNNKPTRFGHSFFVAIYLEYTRPSGIQNKSGFVIYSEYLIPPSAIPIMSSSATVGRVPSNYVLPVIVILEAY